MSLGKICGSSRYGCQSFQADSRLPQPLPKDTANFPGPSQVPGIYTYKCFDCLIVPSGKRFAVIMLNQGKPFPLQWAWNGKCRTDWRTIGDAKFSVRQFVRYAKSRKWVVYDKSRQHPFLPGRESAEMDTRDQGMRVSRDTPGATNKPGGTNHSNVATNLAGKCQPEKVTGAVRGLPIVTDGGSTHSVQGQVPQVNPPDRTANDPLPPVCTIDSLVTTAGGTPMTKLTETELNKQQQSA